jgi:hypothetical protein
MIMAIHHVPSLTQERYEAVLRSLTNGKSHVDSLADLSIEGLLVHGAGQTDNGFVIFDVFESQEAFDRFTEAVRPIAQEVGIEEAPKAYLMHSFAAGLLEP